MRISHCLRIFNAALLVIFSIACHSQTIRTVVLDAGHGGKDPGTVNGRNYEKTVNLAVTKLVGAMLEKNPMIKVVYTRKEDKFIALVDRSKIAQAVSADLFVSIHTNSNPNKKRSGSETYILGVDKSNANLGVAMRENGVISLENDYTTAYEGYDPSSSESLIMFSLMQYSFSRESLELATIIQKQYKNSGRRDNGVKQAGFLVLWRTAAPSVLTELGYLSNEEEAKYLLSKSGQAELATSIAASVEAYLKSCEQLIGRKAPAVPKTTPVVAAKPVVEPPVADEVEDVIADVIIETGEEQKTAAVHFSVQVRAATRPINVNSENFGPLVTQISERKTENFYKYTVGMLVLFKDALLLQDKIRKIFPDAFIVAYDCENRPLTVADARKIIDNK